MRMLAEDELREAVSSFILSFVYGQLFLQFHLFSGSADLRQQAGSAKCNERGRDHGQAWPSQPEKQKLVHSGETNIHFG